jgi:hypothetical protein
VQLRSEARAEAFPDDGFVIEFFRLYRAGQPWRLRSYCAEGTIVTGAEVASACAHRVPGVNRRDHLPERANVTVQVDRAYSPDQSYSHIQC